MWMLLSSYTIKRCFLLGRKGMTNLDSILKSRDITLPTKVRLVKAMVFPAVMYGVRVGNKESWVPKNWCFWTVVLEKALESPLDCKEIQPVHSEGDQPWDFCWNSSTLATSCKELTHWKRLWCWEGLGAGGEGDDQGWDGWMASRTRWTLESEWTPGVGDGQGGLTCCNSWSCKESDRTEWLNWTES